MKGSTHVQPQSQPDNVSMGLKCKEEGNKFMSKKEYLKAIEKYAKAIEFDAKNPIYYSNRCAAYTKLAATLTEGQRQKRAKKQGSTSKKDEVLLKALVDANKCLELDPSWPKGYLRQAHTLYLLSRLVEAKASVEKGLACLAVLEKDAERAVIEPVSVALDESKLKAHKSGLLGVLNEINLKLKEQENLVFFEKVKGKWHGKVADELGGYEQEFQFVSPVSVVVNIMERQVCSKLVLDASQSPVQMNLSVELSDDTSNSLLDSNSSNATADGTAGAGGNQQKNSKEETVLYICKLVEKENEPGTEELWLCSPDPSTPLTRPTEFSGVTLIVMKRGALPTLESTLDTETKEKLAMMSKDEKVIGYVQEALVIFPEEPNERLMPLQSDSPELQQKISLLNVKFQAENFKITKKYGVDIEERVRDLLVGFSVHSDREIMDLVKELRTKMQKAMLLPPNEEMKEFIERQKDYQGEVLPKDFVAKSNPSEVQQKSKEEKKHESGEKEKSPSAPGGVTKSDLIVITGIAVGVAAIGLAALFLLRQK